MKPQFIIEAIASNDKPTLQDAGRKGGLKTAENRRMKKSLAELEAEAAAIKAHNESLHDMLTRGEITHEEYIDNKWEMVPDDFDEIAAQ